MPKDLSPYGEFLLKQVKGSSQQVNPSPQAVIRWGMDRPESVMHVLPEEFRAQLLALPDELFSMSEPELENKIGGITRQDRRVRLNLWDEYERAYRESREIDFRRVVAETGLPNWEMYKIKLYQEPGRLAWIMRAPPSYALQMRESHELGLNRLNEILSLSLKENVYNRDGDIIGERINTSIGMLILQAIKLIDNRRMGAPTQKNVNLNLESKAPDADAKPASMEEIEKRLRELLPQVTQPHTLETTATPVKEDE
jgi:hypothetical protein